MKTRNLLALALLLVTAIVFHACASSATVATTPVAQVVATDTLVPPTATQTTVPPFANTRM